MFHQTDVRVEAGSARKPNREKDAANMQQAMQVLGPLVTQYAQMTGDNNPLNALIEDWAKSIELADPERYLLRQPMLPPPDPSAEIAAQEGQMEMQLKQQESEIKQQEAQLESQARIEELLMGREEHRQEMGQDQAVARQELRQSASAHAQTMRQDKAKGELALKLQKQKAAAQRAQAAKNGEAK